MTAADRAAALAVLVGKARACRVCEAHLPLGPRPVLRASATAKLLIVGQAPGTKVHDTGIPWNDASGDRLRRWLDLGRDTFYDESRIAIMPMGLCYPGIDKSGGDSPPRPECAPLWHPPLLALMPQVELVLLVGSHAQAWYLGKRRRKTMTDTVAAWREYLPRFIPTPHPSWRNTAWLKRNPWFEAELVPELRERVARML
ncbi:uracil-DNA glycosylase [Skermanella aerolata]|jgi:uracil-DNA glycosylase|uniref:Uracil-DNA glycosylase n=1 Tax=Skermanella aerolata TaxID=393310 RepID=A0A512DWA9_9PROT|nr:uracil-DNA glycosylase family protein [Skermanella aerolata]KJB95485.1 uracil-DNA glycosylase [Skermanella aerolata KACC 11604]GEO40764.1 uracil-DNA glycosylase [Skermanella aerolata]